MTRDPVQPSRQRGMALFVALIMLVLAALLVVAGLGTSLLEERMSSNTYDRNLTFQAAESALREAENIVAASRPTPLYNDTGTDCPANDAALNNCTSGICPTPDPDCQPRWESSSFTGWVDANVALGSLVSSSPQYFIEYLGGEFPCDPYDLDPCKTIPKGLDCKCKRYRITARDGATDRANVVIQTTYATN